MTSILCCLALAAQADPPAIGTPESPHGDDAPGLIDGPELPDIGLPTTTVRPSPIVEGTRSDDRPNVVALAGVAPGSGDARVFCTGTAIQRQWVLTAAHCLTPADSMEASGLVLHVLWGYDIANEGYTHAIPWVQSTPHPAYRDGVFANDIGVVELAEAVPDDVPLTVVNDEPVDDGWIGEELLFVGFGLTRDGGSDSGTMREAMIPVEGYDEQHIYAYSPTSNLCQGDSGGPSFREVDGHLEQVGVNSYVSGGCVGGSSGSANVEQFLPFLEEHVPDLLFEPGYGQGYPFDLGVDDPMYGPGIGVRQGPRRGPGALDAGCDTGGLPSMAWAAGLIALLTRRRRTRS